MGDFIEDFRIYMEPSEVPELYNFWLALSALAAAAQRKIWFDGGLIKVSPNLYIVLVADAGNVRKSFAMSVVQEHLCMKVKGINTNSDRITKEKIFVEMAEGIKQHVFKPPVKIGNVTMDRMMHCSYTFFANEMSVFMDDEKLAASITSLYDCREVFKDSTKNKSVQFIAYPYFNLLGNTTPDWVSNKMQEDLLEGGLVARLMLLFADRPSKRNPFPEITPAMQQALERMILRLEQVCQMGGPFVMSPKCKADFTSWYLSHYREKAANPKLTGYHNRKPIHLVKVAILLSLARKDDLVLETADFQEALFWLDKTEPAIAESLAGVGRNILSPTAQSMLAQIQSCPGGRIDQMLLFRANWHQVQLHEFEEIMKALVMQKKITVVFDETKKIFWVQALKG